MRTTRHADRRIQQRRLSPLILRWLLEFGAHTYDKHGAIIRHFDKRSRKALSRAVGAKIVSQLGRHLNVYAVTCGAEVITAGYRTKRVRVS